MAYWIHENGETLGPFRGNEVLDRAKPETLISHGEQWLRFEEHPDFTHLVQLVSQQASPSRSGSDVHEQAVEAVELDARLDSADAGETNLYWTWVRGSGPPTGPHTHQEVTRAAGNGLLVRDGERWVNFSDHPDFREVEQSNRRTHKWLRTVIIVAVLGAAGMVFFLGTRASDDSETDYGQSVVSPTPTALDSHEKTVTEEKVSAIETESREVTWAYSEAFDIASLEPNLVSILYGDDWGGVEASKERLSTIVLGGTIVGGTARIDGSTAWVDRQKWLGLERGGQKNMLLNLAIASCGCLDAENWSAEYRLTSGELLASVSPNGLRALWTPEGMRPEEVTASDAVDISSPMTKDERLDSLNRLLKLSSNYPQMPTLESIQQWSNYHQAVKREILALERNQGRAHEADRAVWAYSEPFDTVRFEPQLRRFDEQSDSLKAISLIEYQLSHGEISKIDGRTAWVRFRKWKSWGRTYQKALLMDLAIHQCDCTDSDKWKAEIRNTSDDLLAATSSNGLRALWTRDGMLPDLVAAREVDESSPMNEKERLAALKHYLDDLWLDNRMLFRIRGEVVSATTIKEGGEDLYAAVVRGTLESFPGEPVLQGVADSSKEALVYLTRPTKRGARYDAVHRIKISSLTKRVPEFYDEKPIATFKRAVMVRKNLEDEISVLSSTGSESQPDVSRQAQVVEPEIELRPTPEATTSDEGYVFLPAGGSETNSPVESGAHNFPAWVPTYPDSNLFEVNVREAATGAFKFETADGISNVIDYYLSELQASGFNVTVNEFSKGKNEGGVVGAIVDGKNAAAGSQVKVFLTSEGGTTSGEVSFNRN